ncbi:MAG: hypothetical protein Q8P51_10135 [Ignavibacteria bacterium]|nr:hypothetical protein [Ignavibacteria bacterium]
MGSTIEIQIPVECGSDVRSHTFSFSVDSVRHISWNDYRSAGSIPPYSPMKGSRPTSQESFTTAIIIVGGFLG